MSTSIGERIVSLRLEELLLRRSRGFTFHKRNLNTAIRKADRIPWPREQIDLQPADLRATLEKGCD